GPLVHSAVDGLTAEQLAEAPEGANPIGWLVWHLTRIQDHHVAGLLEEPQRWIEDGWHQRFGLPADPENHGYGHDADDVATIRPDGPELLIGYYDAVAARTTDLLHSIDVDTLDRVVDESWDPPVTMAVRVVSIASDDLQHVAQAHYLRGLLHLD
ncbi:MAG: DUF664 domain-containing protein, partial [Acidimicrobiia bacterium]|nr:DUF664 domain-containing protein [Acidimicrobiia bacterium]